MKDEIRRYGIVEIVERSQSVDELAQAREPKLEDYFPKLEWLETELALAHDPKGNLMTRPHTDWGWYLQSMIAEIGLMNSARQQGNTDYACICAVELGQLMMEAKIKFEWEADALRGRKVVERSDSTRRATDEDRRELVEKIIAERGKGARDAFRIAAQRYPYMGRESTFRTSYYKKASKRGQ